MINKNKWFRAVIDSKTGKFDVVEVEGVEKNGKFVRYVEAPNKATAVRLLVDWFTRESEARKARARERARERVAGGMCMGCSTPALPGLTVCARHKQVKAEGYQRRQQPGYVKAERFVRLADRTPEQVAAAAVKRLAHVERIRRNTGLKRKAVTGLGLTFAGFQRESHELGALRKALASFDSLTPQRFKAWLVGQIRQLETRQRKADRAMAKAAA